MKKEVVLIGATGFVGSAILNELVNRNHRVRAVARDISPLEDNSCNVKAVAADVSSQDAVAAVCEGARAVISAYNPGWKDPDIYYKTLRVYPAILNGVKKAGAKRFLVVGGAGTLYVAPRIRLMDSGKIPENMLPAVVGLGEFYLNTLIHEKDIDWVFFSPAAKLVHGERTGRYRLGLNELITDDKGESMISVEDYAKAMVDELESPAHHHERFTIGY